MYCSIQEAWGDNNNAYIHQNQNISNVSDDEIKQFLEWKKSNPNQNSSNQSLDDVCLKILNHIKMCPKCSNYIKGNSYNNSFLNFPTIDINNTNKELILMFLIGILLILIFHLFAK